MKRLYLPGPLPFAMHVGATLLQCVLQGKWFLNTAPMEPQYNIDLPQGRQYNSRIYPWDQWLDGRCWELQHGVDFYCSTASIQGRARRQGKALGMHVATTSDGGKVYIQAVLLDRVA